MNGKTVLIHYREFCEIYNVDQIRTMNLRDLHARVQARFLTGLSDFVKNPCLCLCDGLNASKPLDEDGFRKMVDSISNSTTTRSDNVTLVDKKSTNNIELWLREFGK